MVPIYVLLLTFISAFFGAVTGFGTSTIMVPILAIWYPLPEVLFFVVVVHLFGELWKVLFYKKVAHWKLIIFFGLPGIVASYFAASLPLAVDPFWLKRLLAVFLLADTIFVFTHPKWKLADSKSNAVYGGVLSGFFAGIFGIGGAIRGVFLGAFNMPKATYIFTSSMIAVLIEGARAFRYYQGNVALDSLSFQLLLYTLPILLISDYLGKRTVDKIPQSKFRYIVGVGLLVSSVALLVGL